MQTEVNPGSGLEDLGSSQLISVPYALYADSARYPGPAGSMAVDFGYLYLNGSGAGTAVANASSIPFSVLSNTPASTNLSLAGGNLHVNSSGFYEITFGVSTTANNSIFNLTVDGTVVQQNNIETTALNTWVSNKVIIILPAQFPRSFVS